MICEGSVDHQVLLAGQSFEFPDEVPTISWVRGTYLMAKAGRAEGKTNAAKYTEIHEENLLQELRDTSRPPRVMAGPRKTRPHPYKTDPPSMGLGQRTVPVCLPLSAGQSTAMTQAYNRVNASGVLGQVSDCP